MNYEARIFGYDVIKAIAMFMVVFYHIDVNLGECMTNGAYLFNFNKFCYGILASSVPLFFMVNGALMKGRLLSIKGCIIKSVRLMIVATVWTTILRCGMLHWLFARPQIASIPEFFTYYWFLTTLAELYLITWFLQRIPLAKRIVIPALLLFPFLTNFFGDCRLFYEPNSELPRWGHTGVFTMYSIVYYYVGQYLVDFTNRHTLSRWWYGLPVLVGLFLVHFEVIAFSNHDHALYDGVNSSFPTMGALFISSGLFCLLKDVKLKESLIKRVLSDVGSNTIGVYVFHFIFIVLLSECLWHGSALPPYVVLIEAALIVLVTSYISKIILNSPLRFLLKL